MSKEKERIQILDTARGISIIMMTLTHIPNLEKYPAFYHLNEVLVIFKMPLFIFISGFLFSTRLGFKDFFVHKVDGLLKPCFFALLLIAIVTSVREYFHINHSSPRFHYYLERPFIYLWDGVKTGNFDLLDSPLWFIYPLFLTQVVFRSFWGLYHRQNLMIATILLIPVLVGLMYCFKNNIGFWGIGLVFPFLIYFSIGHSQKHLARMVGMRQYFYSHTAGILCTILFCFFAYKRKALGIVIDLHTMQMGNIFNTFWASLFGIYMVLYLCNYIGKLTVLKNFLVNCSKASFFILAFHLVFINIFYYWYPFRLIPETGFKALAIFILNVPLSYLFYIGVKRVPFLRLFLLPLKTLTFNEKEKNFVHRVKNLFGKKKVVLD